MAGLRALKKRLKSIRMTGQLASAMRTAAAAKYSRAGAARNAYDAYAASCGGMLACAGDAGMARTADVTPDARRCLVVLSGNRGLCGGFNAELLRFFFGQYREEPEPPLTVACGKIAIAACAERGVTPERTFPLSDIPTYEETRAISAYIRDMYTSGAVTEVEFLYQKFDNMLKQTPVRQRVLPASPEAETADDADVLFLPDRETVCNRLAATCLDAEVYDLALENATGAQAATLMAMRSAYDNATETAAQLELTINRRRQAEVTEGVIETASDNIQ